ncbi:MAG: sensor histidine kinase [Methanosarcina sp.]
MQGMRGIVGFQLEENFVPIFMHGSVEAITGYNEQDFLSGEVRWADIVEPVDKFRYLINRKEILNTEFPIELEYRIQNKNGKTKWVREILQKISNNPDSSLKIQGFIEDITKNKELNYAINNKEDARIKEIHHRIKNNLQIISSLLYLQAEKFDKNECVGHSDIFEAFRECQNRVASISLIHQELYKSKNTDNLDFTAYIKKLTNSIIDSYTIGRNKVRLNLNLEHVCLDMERAIPLGIIVNEIISNSIKYAFPGKRKGEIWINLCKNKENFHYIFTIADNGIGISEDIDLENTDSLGLKLVNILVNQIDGKLEINRASGTEFKICF